MENTSANYPEALLKSRTYNNFVTIPQTTIDEEKLHKALSEYGQVEHLITKLEQHEDGGRHIHLLLKFKTNIALKNIHNIIYKQEGTIGGTINYQKVKNYPASMNYINKEETSVEGHPPLEHGEAPQFTTGGDRKGQTYLEAITKAQQGDVEGALADIRECDPIKYLQYKQQYTQNLTTENQVRKKYTLPDYGKNTVKLSAKQQEVWDLLQTTPKARRIIWVSGDYGSGKSYLYNYIKANHDYGMYDAGQSASLDNVVYGYDEEGVIAWDLPRTFNFQDLGNSMASVIEKFSDFGQSITSKKYSGKTQHVRGHVIVFSNSKPLEQLAHRDIIHIDLSPENKSEPVIQPIKDKVKADEQEEAVEDYTISTDMDYIHEADIDNHLKQFISRHDGIFYIQGGKRRFATEQEAIEEIKRVESKKQNKRNQVSITTYNQVSKKV